MPHIFDTLTARSSMKKCRRCGKEFPATTEYFYKEKRKKGGLTLWCKQCRKKYLQEDKERFRERRKIYKKKYYQQEQHKKARRDDSRRWKYGISPEDYSEMLQKQNNLCAICGKHQSNLTRSLAVDHCHISGKVRGLLCPVCNSMLGWYEKNKDRTLIYLG